MSVDRRTSAAGEQAGHAPTLFACFVHFDICFMLWVLIGALGAFIFDGTTAQASLKGLLVGTPVLIGSLLRVPLGILSDRFGARRMAIGLLLFLVVPLLIGWLAPARVPLLLITAVTLGAAGSSFAIVLPLASRWYPRERQGLVMGIAAAGNSGTVVANLVAPRIAAAIGWHSVFGLALIPLGVALVLFVLLAREAPGRGTGRSAADYLAAIHHADTWWFCFFYCITFGGYVGLSSFLPIFLHDRFGMTPVAAGSLTAAAAFAGSFSRPAGGYVADRFGGTAVLQALFAIITLAYTLLAVGDTLTLVAPVLLATMVCLGLGNGVVFQLVPLRFAREIGIATGIVGAVGGVGGFLLPAVLGAVRQTTGAYTLGFAVLGLVAAAGAVSLRALQSPRRARAWRLVQS